MSLVRGIDPDLLAALQGAMFYPVVLVHVDWPGAPVRAHSGTGTLVWEGAAFTGVGDLGEVRVGEEAAALVPQSIEIALSAPYEDLLADVIGADLRGRAASVWAGCTTTPGGTVLIGRPERLGTGVIKGDDLPAPQGGQVRYRLTIEAGVHGRFGGVAYHSDAAHQQAYPGDDLFERSARASEWRSNPVKF